MQNKHILVVEDDPKIRALLRACFEREGAIVSEATSIKSVQQAFTRAVPDLVTLDIGLAGEDGLDITRDLRRTYDTPIIMVTGKGDVIDRIVGLEIGADASRGDSLGRKVALRKVDLERVLTAAFRTKDGRLRASGHRGPIAGLPQAAAEHPVRRA